MTPLVSQVADGTFLVKGHAVNWILLTEGDQLTLIDAGYPGDFNDVVTSINSIGFRPEQIAAILITHAHIDHIGALPKLLRVVDAPVFTSTQEAEHAHRDYLEQASRTDVALRCWRPRVLKWARHVIAAGGTEDVLVPEARPFPRVGALDVPGHPVPVMTPGHTSGHTCYYLPTVGTMVTGDALVTGHAISRWTGPQLLDEMFHHDLAENIDSLRLLSGYSADTLLPGHGPVWNAPIAQAVSQALG